MNILNMKNKEETKYLNIIQCTVKNREVLFIMILSMLFLIFQVAVGKIVNFEQRVFVMEVIKMPYMFLIPFFLIKKERREKQNIKFYLISFIIFIVIAIVNKMGLSSIYYGHKYQIFETVGVESLTAAVLYTYPIYYIVKNYLEKRVLINGIKGIMIGVLFVLNYLSFKNITDFKIYTGTNIYIYILVGMMALYYGLLSEFYYRAAVMDTFLKNGMKPIAAYVVVSVLYALGVVFSDPALTANITRGAVAMLFLFGSSIFFSYIYVKTGKSIIASGVAKAAIIFAFYLSFKVM